MFKVFTPLLFGQLTSQMKQRHVEVARQGSLMSTAPPTSLPASVAIGGSVPQNRPRSYQLCPTLGLGTEAPISFTLLEMDGLHERWEPEERVRVVIYQVPDKDAHRAVCTGLR